MLASEHPNARQATVAVARLSAASTLTTSSVALKPSTATSSPSLSVLKWSVPMARTFKGSATARYSCACGCEGQTRLWLLAHEHPGGAQIP